VLCCAVKLCWSRSSNWTAFKCGSECTQRLTSQYGWLSHVLVGTESSRGIEALLLACMLQRCSARCPITGHEAQVPHWHP
jgi:hypothetical protein